MSDVVSKTQVFKSDTYHDPRSRTVAVKAPVVVAAAAFVR